MKKTVLITGCSSGIGRELALACNEAGYRTHATARKLSAIENLTTKGILIHQLDVTDEASIDACLAEVEETGPIDVLVNNAGYGAIAPMLDLSMEELRRQYETNVFSIVALTQRVAGEMMVRRTGTIVNIGSISGIMTTPFGGAYCSSKAAVHALGDALRIELAPFGIRVLTVQPGGIRTKFGDTAEEHAENLFSPESAYQPIASKIRERAQASQGKKATSAKDFARALVRRLDSESAAPIRIGHGSRLVPFMKRWLPAQLLDRMLSRRFGLDSLSAD